MNLESLEVPLRVNNGEKGTGCFLYGGTEHCKFIVQKTYVRPGNFVALALLKFAMKETQFMVHGIMYRNASLNDGDTF